uniref:Sulfhydryl oxidase n=1 Tax=Toxocara canis TaxID=6265 RepID=A0A183VGY5_TOXCA
LQAVVAEEKRPTREDCPLDTEQLGKSTWNFLHTMAAYFPEEPSEEDRNNAVTMMKLLGKLYPCAPCAEGLRRDLASHPPRVENRDAFSVWMCELHNRVSKKLGKKEFDCSLWKERWLDGWKDGSCDY